MAEGEVIYSQSEKNDFKRFLYKYLRYWYLFVISIALFLTLAFVLLRMSTPQYLISSSILIRDIDKGPDFQSGDPVFKDLDIFNAATSIENEIEALKSITLMQRVLTELSLQTSYYVDAFLSKREIYGSELPIRVRISRINNAAYKQKVKIVIKNSNEFEWQDGALTTHTCRFGESVVRPYGTFTVLVASAVLRNQPQVIHVVFHDLRDLALDYQEKLTVAQVNKKANVLTVSMLSPVPEKGKAIVNKLIDEYNTESKEDRNLLAMNTINFIDERLRDLTGELSDIERSVEQFKRRNQVTDVRSEATAYLEESRNYSNQLSNLNIQLDVAESLERYLSQQQDQFELVPSNLRIDDPTLVDLITRFNELQLQRERLLRTAEPANPLVININQQLANLRLNILENLSTIKRGLIVTRDNLANKAGGFRSRISQIPEIERQLNAINRQEGVKRDLYVYLLQKREESALSLAATGSNTRVIDPAIASKTPVQPKKPVFFGVAFVLGLVLPLGFIMVRDFLSDKVQRKKDITKSTSVPVLGEISHFGKKGYLAVSKGIQTPHMEQFRLLRSNLDFAAPQHANQVILVTSSMPGEGKTFVGINLAVSLSFAGRSVVLVDFDLRQPGIINGLGLNSGPGVSDFVNRKDLAADAVIGSTSAAPDLAVIGAGSLPDDPTEFMMSPRVSQLITELRERFDHIIIDTAPMGQVADAYSLAPFIDVTIFVVRYNFTPKAQIDNINEIVDNKKLNQPMIVLNDARRENSYALKQRYAMNKYNKKKRV
ncbi:polysaccharide biosynthesis tyrosine autokinase [Nibrella saemangeumensis]|uniref:non-specific protein-tyrosine kinase n=1 Tax=Nibrella saemangeumensis TaxID=1084526 RepID=A0ABP8MHN3_9BACT